ncbi:Hypothetical protein I595_3653 [Croceitalea dokdonensis DOKDO 023]|uniref:DoxX family protein n=1 Tax=Croceitalea dokdonensis DOKDO 023 TaxID=1300341 RepID=A0A0P7AMG0_9FLAO|nr:DoxX family protein [Croceitalea dokdonensis]KPM30243.1 Hypothetical protein I595_3653 [Croceitalea dokdonensis DOKDO 023]
MRFRLSQLFLPFYTNYWLLNCFIKVPQVAMGGLLAFHFGSRQFGVPWSPRDAGLGWFEVAPYFLDLIHQFHAPIPTFAYGFALFSGITKVFGGISLILGFATRIVALAILLVMVVFMLNQETIGFNFTYPLFFISVAISALYFGCGRYGVDYLLTRKG